jgi:large conductance mechanosensitive channel
MWKDFKSFLGRGNVLDLAIGVIMGAAFGKIVSTFTEGIIMPIVSLIAGGMDYKSWVINLSGQNIAGMTVKEITDKGFAVLRIGEFISDIINFVIVGLVMFMVAKWAMSYFAKLAAETPPPPQEALLTEIRDILAKKK